MKVCKSVSSLLLQWTTSVALTTSVAVSSEFKRDCQTNCQKVVSRFTSPQTDSSTNRQRFAKNLALLEKEILQPVNAADEFLNISLPYTVAYKQQCYVGLSIVVNVSKLPTAANQNVG